MALKSVEIRIELDGRTNRRLHRWAKQRARRAGLKQPSKRATAEAILRRQCREWWDQQMQQRNHQTSGPSAA